LSKPLPDFAAAAAEDKLTFIEIHLPSLARLTRFPDTEPWWGTSRRYRFDDTLQTFGVTYAARELEVAFAETVLHEAAFFEDGAWIVPRDQIEARWIVNYDRANPTLKLLDLTGIHAKRLGLNNDICSGSDYAFTQALSRAVHDQVPQAEGIYYVSRQLNTTCAAALFERCAARRGPLRSRLAQHPDYPTLLDTFNVEIV
jgi:hypothetical protein